MQIFLADAVVDADDSPFQKGERAFRCVGVNVAANIFPRAMCNGVMAAFHL